MEDDWDLYAVVRGCSYSSSTTTNSAAATTSSSSSFTTGAATSSCSTDVFSLSGFQTEQENDQFLYFSDLQELPRSNNNIEELHDLFKPFCSPRMPPISSQITIPVSPLSVLQDLSQQPIQKEKQKQILVGSRSTTFAAAAAAGGGTTRHNPQNPRSKRRKNQMKRVCQVPAEGLSSDMWSWRKYGQKPIKGSPYPRGYYRCSTSKGCLARKQVERNRSDPNMFIVTYTAEHNHPIPTHRNSLAGSTRQKPATSETVTDGDTSKPTCSTPISPAASLSPGTEKLEVEEEDDEFGGSDMGLSDDYYQSDRRRWILRSFPISVVDYNATTTAAGGV